MKILYVCKTLPFAFKGGIQTHVWKLSEWMVKRGHQVSILTSGSWRKKVQIEEIEGRKIISLPYFPGRHLPQIGALVEEWSFNKAAASWLKTEQKQFDIIHLQGRSGNTFLDNPTDKKVPVVNTLHGFMGIESERRGLIEKVSFAQKLHLNWVQTMENKALKNADRLITVSQEMQRALVERIPDCYSKSVIVPNGIDVPPINNSIVPNNNRLVFVGRLDRIKGIFPLVEAMKKVHPRIELMMIGDGDMRPALEKAIQAAGLEKRIQLTGSLESSVVFDWIQKSYALILPSFHETQGIVLMEANSCGKPVLASDINGINEVVQQGKNGLLFEKNNPVKIAQAINYLFSNPVEAKQMGTWGKAFVNQQFSWKNIASRTEEVYHECLKTQSPAKLTTYA
ncbi:MAG: glycosyltransferase involved in cell wall biosynthesis [Saprospiraceae bacterium]|jgi:glycosyltransferase involved in cell wall biosynthesis